MSDSDITCITCRRMLAEWNSSGERYEPSVEVLHSTGSVAVPNLGWFCCQACAGKFEQEHGLTLRRDASGNVRYYD
jgi:hypothetical protein